MARPPAAPRPPLPASVLARLRPLCASLPEVIAEPAWLGQRWRVRQHSFAHVLMVADGWPPAYARAAGSHGPLCVLTFRSPLPPLDLHAFTWAPFFRPGWFATLVGMRLDDATDWDEVADLLRASYRLLAPRKLARRLDGPG